MPQQLTTEQEQPSELRRIRYSPSEVVASASPPSQEPDGFPRESLYRVIRRGWCSDLWPAASLPSFAKLSASQGPHTPSTQGARLGPLDAGPDPRGGSRPVRRPDDRRLLSARRVSREC